MAHYIRKFAVLFVVWGYQICVAQPFVDTQLRINQLNLSGSLPEKLLQERTAVFFSPAITSKELQSIHEYCQRSGIDAMAYYDLDMLWANNDVTKMVADYFTKREIGNILFVEKLPASYRLTITKFNEKETVIDGNQIAWSSSNTILLEILKQLYRTASSLKRQNMLINDVPEQNLPITLISGRRNEFFASDLKVDMLAVPKTGDATMDAFLEAYFTANYPLKFKMTEYGISEKELRRQGYLYVVRIMYTRNSIARSLLGYDVSKPESAYATNGFTENGDVILKNIPINTNVYKVYFKHIDSGNTFLGTKWDADTTLEAALRNQWIGMKKELRIN
jgi:hypothetical protein